MRLGEKQWRRERRGKERNVLTFFRRLDYNEAVDIKTTRGDKWKIV